MEVNLVKDENKRIAAFIETALPEDWEHWDLERRKEFWRDGGLGGVRPRKRVCAMEILQELFDLDPTMCTQRDARRINNIIKRIPFWQPSSSVECGPYGRQRGFIFNALDARLAEMRRTEK